MDKQPDNLKISVFDKLHVRDVVLAIKSIRDLYIRRPLWGFAANIIFAIPSILGFIFELRPSVNIGIFVFSEFFGLLIAGQEFKKISEPESVNILKWLRGLTLVIISAIFSLVTAYFISAWLTPWFLQSTWFIAGFDLIIFFSVAGISSQIYYSWLRFFYSWLSDYSLSSREKKIEQYWLLWQKAPKYLGKFIFAAAALLGTVTGIIALLLPSISVSQSMPLNPVNPISAPFIVSNDSVLPIESVQLSCIFNNVTTNYGTFNDDVAEDGSQTVDRMDAGEKESDQCSLNESSMITYETPPIYENADIALAVRFRVYFTPWYQCRIFRFTLTSSTNGNFYWFPQPDSDLNESEIIKNFCESGD